LIPSTNSFNLEPHRIKALRREFFELLGSQAMNLIKIRYEALQQGARRSNQSDLSRSHDSFVDPSIELQIDLSAIRRRKRVPPPQPC
jgi:hypothetical protein